MLKKKQKKLVPRNINKIIVITSKIQFFNSSYICSNGKHNTQPVYGRECHISLYS